MENLWPQILDKYGLVGLMLVAVFVFAAWVMRRVVNHFIDNIVRKDEQITQMSNRFSSALDANTKAINELTQTEIKLTSACENIVNGYNQTSNQNKLEHSEILEYVRRKHLNG